MDVITRSMDMSLSNMVDEGQPGGAVVHGIAKSWTQLSD